VFTILVSGLAGICEVFSINFTLTQHSSTFYCFVQTNPYVPHAIKEGISYESSFYYTTLYYTYISYTHYPCWLLTSYQNPYVYLALKFLIYHHVHPDSLALHIEKLLILKNSRGLSYRVSLEAPDPLFWLS
jgi:hypothetical protein